MAHMNIYARSCRAFTIDSRRIANTLGAPGRCCPRPPSGSTGTAFFGAAPNSNGRGAMLDESTFSEAETKRADVGNSDLCCGVMPEDETGHPRPCVGGLFYSAFSCLF